MVWKNGLNSTLSESDSVHSLWKWSYQALYENVIYSIILKLLFIARLLIRIMHILFVLIVFRDATSFGYTVRLRVKNAFIEQYSRRGDINGTVYFSEHYA